MDSAVRLDDHVRGSTVKAKLELDWVDLNHAVGRESALLDHLATDHVILAQNAELLY